MENIQYKAVGVTGVTKVTDEGKGVVTAFVSVTGLKDNVNDVIEPKAYQQTLAERKPKGVWSHDWKTPTARTLAADELPPGHKDLPAKLPTGQPWPSDAGALRIKMKFNLDTQRGRDAYSDVLFFGPEQEWSIGYSVPKGGSEVKDGVRYIKKLNLYEYSPVLWGAMTHARTAESVKDAQIAYKAASAAMHGEVLDINEINEKLAEFKQTLEATLEFKDADGTDQPADEFEGDEDVELDNEESEEEEPEDDEDVEDEGEDEKDLGVEVIRKAIHHLQEALAYMEGADVKADTSDVDQLMDGGFVAYLEAKATQYSTVSEAVDEMDAELPSSDQAGLEKAAKAFDQAVADGDTSAAEQAGEQVLQLVQDALESLGDEGEGTDSLRVIARTVADCRDAMDSNMASEDQMKTMFDVGEFKVYIGQLTSREYGLVMQNDTPASGMDAVEAYVKGLDDARLYGLAAYLEGVAGERKLKRIVNGAITSLEQGEQPESKMDYSADEMAQMGKMGHAFRNGNGDWSYPTKTAQDLDNAIRAWGRSMVADRGRLKSYLMKRAKEMKAPQEVMDRINNLQAGIKEDVQLIDLSEFKELNDLLEALPAFE